MRQIQRKDFSTMRVSGKMFKGLIAVVSFAAAIAVAGPVAAEPVFDVAFGLAAGWKSDSNFYKDQIDTKQVWTYTISPSVSVSKETANLEFNFDYALDAKYYRDQDSTTTTPFLSTSERAASDKDYLGHQIEAKALYKLSEMITLGLDGAYMDTLDPKVSDSLAQSTDNDEYFIARFSPLAEFKFGREGRLYYNMRYRNSNIEYDNSVQEGSEEHRGIFELGYELTAAMTVGLEYQLAKMDYDKATSDYMTNQGMLVVNYDLGLFSLEAGAGVNDRDFDDAGVDEMETFTYRTKLSMEGAATKITLGSQYNFNDRGPGNGYYTAHKVGLDAEFSYIERLPLGFGGYYQQSDYEITRSLDNNGNLVLRKDNIYQVYGSIGYEITDWITFTVQGGYEDMASNTVDNSYDNTFFVGAIEIDLYPR